MEKKDCNILIVGVGGQGNILAGKIISEAFVASGYDVKQSEVHGMAQRGGAVSAHVRAGEKVYSPLIPETEADFILSFEQLETLRYLNYASKKTTVIMNMLRNDPPSVATGADKYPTGVLERIEKKTKKIITLDANSIAKELGTERVTNSVLVGCLAQLLPLKKNVWEKMYRSFVKEKLVDINLKALEAGMELVEKS